MPKILQRFSTGWLPYLFIVGFVLLIPAGSAHAALTQVYSQGATTGTTRYGGNGIGGAASGTGITYISIKITGNGDNVELDTPMRMKRGSGTPTPGTTCTSDWFVPSDLGASPYTTAAADVVEVFIPVSGSDCASLSSGVAGWYRETNEMSPSNTSFGNPAAVGDGSDVFFAYYQGEPDPDTTLCTSGISGNCIDTILPNNGDTLATSSAPWLFEFTGYVASTTWKEGTRLHVVVQNNSMQQCADVGCAVGGFAGNSSFDFEITESGAFDLSTTSEAWFLNASSPIGLYRIYASIQVPDVGIHFWFINFDIHFKDVVLKNSKFYLSEPTALDILQESYENTIGNIIASSTNPLASCSFSGVFDFSFGGDLFNCMGGIVSWLFIPPSGTIQANIESLKANFLNRAPWGYFTRFVVLISPGGASVEPPGIVYTFGTASDPQIQGKTVEINMWDHAGDILPTAVADDGSDKNIWDIVNPYFTVVVSLAVLLVFLSDIAYIEIGYDKTQDAGGANRNILTRKERRVITRSSKRPTDSMGRTGEERRRVINERGQAHDRAGGRGIIH